MPKEGNLGFSTIWPATQKKDPRDLQATVRRAATAISLRTNASGLHASDRLEGATGDVMKRKFTLLQLYAVVCLVCVAAAVLVTARARNHKVRELFARANAERILFDTQEEFVGTIALYRRLPGGFTGLKHESFLREHFVFKGSSLAAVASGEAVVAVRPDSKWLLNEPGTLKQLQQLNYQASLTAKELNASPLRYD